MHGLYAAEHVMIEVIRYGIFQHIIINMRAISKLLSISYLYQKRHHFMWCGVFHKLQL